MLVLSRKIGESLIVGNEIRIKIVEVRGNQVRLGVEAPGHISVVREELHRAVAEANREALREGNEPAPIRLIPGPGDPPDPSPEQV